MDEAAELYHICCAESNVQWYIFELAPIRNRACENLLIYHIFPK